MTSRKRAASAGCSVFFFAWLRSLFSALAVDDADDEEDRRGDQHEKDRPEPPDGRRGQHGELHVFTLRGEEQVAAHRGRLDRLPASVGPADKDGAVIHAHLLGREIADRVLGQRVAREGKLPLLGNGAVDGHGRQRPLGEEGEIIFKRGAAVIRELRERAGIGRLRGGGERVRLVELALDEENAAAVRALRVALEGGAVGGVFGGDDGIKAQVGQVGAVPDRIAPALLRQTGEDGEIEGVAVVKAQRFERSAVADKAECKAEKVLGHTVERTEGSVVHRLRLPG